MKKIMQSKIKSYRKARNIKETNSLSNAFVFNYSLN